MAAWSYVVLEDIHPLYGGFRVTVTGGNEVWTIVVGGGPMQGHRFRAKLPQEAFRDLERILAAHPPRNMDPFGASLPVPDESVLTITFGTPGGRIVARKMSGQKDLDFEAVAHFLTDVSRIVAKNTSPTDQGSWNHATGFLTT